MIDSSAIIHPTAKIGAQVTIGPWTVIGPYVEIDEGTVIGPHVVINGPTRIGKNNRIYQFASVGEAPQDKKYKDEDTVLIIGNNNTIREYCTLNRGTNQGGGTTRIGDNNWLMAYVHIAHDCVIGNETIFANNASLAGHVHVDDYAIISAFCGVHQFCFVGAHSFIARASYASKDVLPYIIVAGYIPEANGINTEGLKRRGFSSDTIESLRRAYKIIFRRGLTVQQAITELEECMPECPEIGLFISALKKSERGFVR